jgi:hypothetical protein
VEPEIPGCIGSVEKTSGGDMTQIKRGMPNKGIVVLYIPGLDTRPLPNIGEEITGENFRLWRVIYKGTSYTLADRDGELVLHREDRHA